MRDELRITIVGAGITGLTTAALLAKSPNADALKVSVIDAAKRPEFLAANDIALRVSAIANGSVELLQSVDAWEHVLSARASPYDRMQVWDANDVADSATALSFDAAEFAVKQLGFIVENVLLQDALLKSLAGRGIEFRFETRIDAHPKADLVIGADGARSFVRDLAGIESVTRPYEQSAFITHLETEIPHDGRALQRFLRAGPLGMLPLADGRISVVWSTSPSVAAAALEMDDAELGRTLTDASDRILGDLTVSGPRGTFPLSAQHAENYVRSGIALVGDAAHAIHPLAGQGANLGLQDAAELVRVIDEAIAEGQHPGDRPVLRRYERARKGANLTMLHFMTGLNRLFTTDSALLGEMRLAGMRLFNRSGPIRERVVKVALGVNERY